MGLYGFFYFCDTGISNGERDVGSSEAAFVRSMRFTRYLLWSSETRCNAVCCAYDIERLVLIEFRCLEAHRMWGMDSLLYHFSHSMRERMTDAFIMTSKYSMHETRRYSKIALVNASTRYAKWSN